MIAMLWNAMAKTAAILLVILLAMSFGSISAVGWVLQRTGKHMLLASIWGLDQVVVMKRFILGEEV